MTLKNDHLKNPDGSWKYTNHLSDAVSPYLQQHAHNPVDWYAWGEEAFEKARKEDKPILVSIGYSTCYWCHVMERQVFENPDIAALMNQHFVNIKVDREERPDLDDIYMTARQLMTHEGGWPNNVFLTPKLEPFFAGGTFGPDSRYGNISFPDLVTVLHHSWISKRSDVERTAAHCAQSVRQHLTTELNPKPPAEPYATIINNLAGQLKAFCDSRDGGFFHAPKFPHENYLLYLLGYFKRTQDQDITNIITLALDKMAAGGIFDHVGGGFHRYAVDQRWLVPHFEKMLYNQAELAKVYTLAYDAIKIPYYRSVAERTLDFVLSEMTSPEGMFYSALDAETNAIEGEFYVWNRKELAEVLTKKEAALFADYFDLADVPHFEGHKHPDGGVIYGIHPAAALYDAEISVELQKILTKLYKLRQKRSRPHVDDKILTAWNGIMIDAFASAGRIFKKKKYIQAAECAADGILKTMLNKQGILYRVARGGKVSVRGFLADYAYVIQGLISLYKATKHPVWLDKAIDLTRKTDELFWDAKEEGYFFSDGQEQNIVRIKTASDAAIASENGLMVHNLIDLTTLTGDAHWKRNIHGAIHAFYTDIMHSPVSYTSMVHGMLRLPEIDPAVLSPVEITPAQTIANDNKATSKNVLTIDIQNVTIRTVHGKQHLNFDLGIRIADGWHINANPASLEHLIPTQLTLKDSASLEIAKIAYPKSNHNLTVDFSTVDVYSQQIYINVDAVMLEPSAQKKHFTVQGLLTVQACRTGLCLPPANIILRRKVVVQGSSQ